MQLPRSARTPVYLSLIFLLALVLSSEALALKSYPREKLVDTHLKIGESVKFGNYKLIFYDSSYENKINTSWKFMFELWRGSKYVRKFYLNPWTNRYEEINDTYLVEIFWDEKCFEGGVIREKPSIVGIRVYRYRKPAIGVSYSYNLPLGEIVATVKNLGEDYAKDVRIRWFLVTKISRLENSSRFLRSESIDRLDRNEERDVYLEKTLRYLGFNISGPHTILAEISYKDREDVEYRSISRTYLGPRFSIKLRYNLTELWNNRLIALKLELKNEGNLRAREVELELVPPEGFDVVVGKNWRVLEYLRPGEVEEYTFAMRYTGNLSDLASKGAITVRFEIKHRNEYDYTFLEEINRTIPLPPIPEELARRIGVAPPPARVRVVKPPRVLFQKKVYDRRLSVGETTVVELEIKPEQTAIYNLQVYDPIPMGVVMVSGSNKGYFESLRKGETVIVSYVIRVGKTGIIEMPPAIATFKDSKGNVFRIESNTVTLEVSPAPAIPTAAVIPSLASRLRSMLERLLEIIGF